MEQPTKTRKKELGRESNQLPIRIELMNVLRD